MFPFRFSYRTIMRFYGAYGCEQDALEDLLQALENTPNPDRQQLQAQCQAQFQSQAQVHRQDRRQSRLIYDECGLQHPCAEDDVRGLKQQSIHDTDADADPCPNSNPGQGRQKKKQQQQQLLTLHEETRDFLTLGEAFTLGLEAAVEADNVVSAELIARAAAPTVLHDPYEYFQPDVISICTQIRDKSPEMFVVMGAYRIIGALSTGQTNGRLNEATLMLEDWLAKSNSLMFRIGSWRKQASEQEADGAGPSPRLVSFLNGRAIVNRSTFRTALLDVGACLEKGQYLVKLGGLVDRMHAPCLRLSLLQYIVGVDQRWQLPLIKGSCKMALEMIAKTFSEDPDY